MYISNHALRLCHALRLYPTASLTHSSLTVDCGDQAIRHGQAVSPITQCLGPTRRYR